MAAEPASWAGASTSGRECKLVGWEGKGKTSIKSVWPWNCTSALTNHTVHCYSKLWYKYLYVCLKQRCIQKSETECLAGRQTPCTMCFYQSDSWRLLHAVPTFLCHSSEGWLSLQVRDGLLPMPVVGKLEPPVPVSASAGCFPLSTSWAFSGGPSTLHFQDFPRWLLCNPDVVYLFICHFKSSNAEKGIEWHKCLLHPRRTKGTCQFPACAFSRLRRLSQSCAPLLKASSHSFTTRRLLFSEKLGFRVVISKEVLALCGSTGAICMLHLGNFPLLMVGLTAAPWQPVVEIH